MMLTLCIVHSQIVSTHSGPSLTNQQDKHRSRRSRHGRIRFSKTRVRRNLRKSQKCLISYCNILKFYNLEYFRNYLLSKTIFLNIGTTSEFKSPGETVSEKGSAISVEVSSSVRFAKKVTIENASTSSPKVRNKTRNTKIENVKKRKKNYNVI